MWERVRALNYTCETDNKRHKRRNKCDRRWIKRGAVCWVFACCRRTHFIYKFSCTNIFIYNNNNTNNEKTPSLFRIICRGMDGHARDNPQKVYVCKRERCYGGLWFGYRWKREAQVCFVKEGANSIDRREIILNFGIYRDNVWPDWLIVSAILKGVFVKYIYIYIEETIQVQI